MLKVGNRLAAPSKFSLLKGPAVSTLRFFRKTKRLE